MGDAALKRRLSRGVIRESRTAGNSLCALLSAIGQNWPTSGVAGLRFWGQTGQCPEAWLAAADPVYLEPRLDHLCLHSLGEGSVASEEVAALMSHLQVKLGDASAIEFLGVDNIGYLRAAVPLATATVEPDVVHGRRPDDFLPAGDTAVTSRGLQSEIEMALHEHPVNNERIARGLAPVNSLWLWGGGYAPEHRGISVPPLFADDYLALGIWLSANGAVAAWPGSLQACANACKAGFAAVVPRAVPEPDQLLSELDALLAAGRVDSVIIAFTDGVRVELRRSDRLRLWRRMHPVFAGSV